MSFKHILSLTLSGNSWHIYSPIILSEPMSCIRGPLCGKPESCERLAMSTVHAASLLLMGTIPATGTS